MAHASSEGDCVGPTRPDGLTPRATWFIRGTETRAYRTRQPPPRRRQWGMITAAAALFALVTVGVIAFQLALALGAPWGAYAMGGSFPGRYPRSMRVAALGQAAVLALLAVIVLSEAGLVLPQIADAAPWAIWLVVLFSGVSLVLNVITPSAGERRIWVPVAVVLLVSSLIVALTSTVGQ